MSNIQQVNVANGYTITVDMSMDPEMMECRANARHDMRSKGVSDEYLDNVRTLTGFMYVTRCTRCDSYRIQMLDAGGRVLPGTSRYDLSSRYVEGGYTKIDPAEAKLWCIGYNALEKKRQSAHRYSNKSHSA
jgi:hypothetical protein